MNKPLLCLISLILMTACSQNRSENIYEWRDAGRTGIFNETNLLKEWPSEGLKEVWTVEDIGNGHGSPTFTDDRFYITGEKESMAVLYCFNLRGEKEWQTTLGSEWVKTHPGSRSAPTIAGDYIYYLTGIGNLYCVSRNNGKIVWSKEFIRDAEGIQNMHGITEAPVIDGDRVFWNPGGKKINVAALNRFNGDILWTSGGLGERSGYNQGNLIRLPSRNIFVTFSAYHLMGFDAQTGELLWSHEQDNLAPEQRVLGMGDTHSNSIIFSEGSLYYAAGDGNCGVKLDLSPDGSEITEVWRNKDFDSFMGGIVKIGDYLYGGGTASPQLLSVNAATGRSSDSLALGSGALIAADGMIYYYSQKGDLNLVKYDSIGKMELISSCRITKGTQQHFSHPVINKGILYLRHGNVLMAFDLRIN